MACPPLPKRPMRATRSDKPPILQAGVEATVRRRQWCDADTARDLISHEELRKLLEVAVGRIESDCR